MNDGASESSATAATAAGLRTPTARSTNSSAASASGGGGSGSNSGRRHRGKRKRSRGGGSSTSGGTGNDPETLAASDRNSGAEDNDGEQNELHPPAKKKPAKASGGRKKKTSGTSSSGGGDGDGGDQCEEKQEAVVHDVDEAKEEEHEQEGEEQQWGCPACTYLNDALRAFCEMCGTTNPTPPTRTKRRGVGLGALFGGSPDAKAVWSCVACTMTNPPGMRICAVCGTINPQASMQSALTIGRRSLSMGMHSEESSDHDDDDDDDDSDDDSEDDDDDDSEDGDESREMSDAGDASTPWKCRFCDSDDAISSSETTCPECYSARPLRRKSPMKAKRGAKQALAKAKKAAAKSLLKSAKPKPKKSAYGVSSDVLRKLSAEPTSSKLIDTLQTLTHTLAMMDASTDSEWGDMRGASLFIRGFGASSAALTSAKDPELLDVLGEIFSQQQHKYPVEVRLLAVQSINYLMKMDRSLFGRAVVLKVVGLYLNDLLQWETEASTGATATGGSLRSVQMVVEECLNGMASVCNIESNALRELVSGDHFCAYLDFVTRLVAPESGFHPSIIVTAMDLLQKCCVRMRWSASSNSSILTSVGGPPSTDTKKAATTVTTPSPQKVVKKQDGVMSMELATKTVALLRRILTHKHVALHVKAAKCLVLVFHRIPFQQPEVITKLVTADVLREFVAVVTNESGDESEDSRQAMISLLFQLFDNRPQLVSFFVQEQIYASLFDGVLPLLRSTSSSLGTSALKLTALLARLVCKKHSTEAPTSEQKGAGSNRVKPESKSHTGSHNRVRLDSAPDPDVLATLLLDFIRADSILAVSALLKDGADLNFPRLLDVHGQEIDKPLQVAAEHASLAMVKYLVKRGADVHQSGPEGTALHVAAKVGRCDIVSFLLQCGASIYATDRNGKNVIESLESMGDTLAAESSVQDDALASSSKKNQLPSAVKKMLDIHRNAIQAEDGSENSDREDHSTVRARTWFFANDHDDEFGDEDDDMMDDEMDHDDEEDEEDEGYYMDYGEEDDDEFHGEEHYDDDEEIPSDDDEDEDYGGEDDDDEVHHRQSEDAKKMSGSVLSKGTSFSEKGKPQKVSVKKRRIDSISSETEAMAVEKEGKDANSSAPTPAADNPDRQEESLIKEDDAALRRQGFVATEEEIYDFSHAILRCLLAVLHDMDIQNVERSVISTLACVMEMAPSQLIRGLSDVDVVLVLDMIHFLLQGQKLDEHQHEAIGAGHIHGKASKAHEHASHSNNSQLKANLSSYILALRILQAIVRKSSAESSIFYQIERRGICEQIEQLNEDSSSWMSPVSHHQTQSSSSRAQPRDTIFKRGLELLAALRANMIESGMLHLHKLKNLARRMREINDASTFEERELAVVDLVELFEHPNSITTYEFKQSELLPAVLQFVAPNHQLNESRVKLLLQAFQRCPEGLKHLVSRLQSIITHEESFPVVLYNPGKGRELYPLTRQLKISFSRIPKSDTLEAKPRTAAELKSEESDGEEEDIDVGDEEEETTVKTIHSSPLTHFQSFERTVARCLPVHDKKLSQLYVNLVGHSVQKVIDGKWKKFWVCGFDSKRSFHLLKPVGGLEDDLIEMVLHDSQYKLCDSVDVFPSVSVNLELFGSIVSDKNDTPKSSKKKRKAANKRKRKLSLSTNSQGDEGSETKLCDVEVRNDGQVNVGKLQGAWYAASIVDSPRSKDDKAKRSSKPGKFETLVKPQGVYSVQLTSGKKVFQKVPAALLRKRPTTPQVGSVVEVDGALGEVTKVYKGERDGVDLLDVKVNRDVEKVRVKKDRIRYPPPASAVKSTEEEEDLIEAMSIRRMFPARDSSVIAGSVGDRVWICPPRDSPVKGLYVAGTIKSFPAGLESIRESSTVNVDISFGLDQPPMTVKVQQDRVINFINGSRNGAGGSRLLAALQMASGRGGHDRLFGGGGSGGALHRAFQQVASEGSGSGSAMDQLRQLISRVSRGSGAEAEGQDADTAILNASTSSALSSTSQTGAAAGEVDAEPEAVARLDELSSEAPSVVSSRTSSPLSRSRAPQSSIAHKRPAEQEDSARNEAVWEYLKRDGDGKPEWVCISAPKVNLNLAYGGRESADAQLEHVIRSSNSSRIGINALRKSADLLDDATQANKALALLCESKSPETDDYELKPRVKSILLETFRTFETTAPSPKKKKRKLSASLSNEPKSVPDMLWDIERFFAFMKRGLNWPKHASRSGIGGSASNAVEQCILFSKFATAASNRRGLNFDGFLDMVTSFCKDPVKSKLVLKYLSTLGYSEAKLAAGGDEEESKQKSYVATDAEDKSTSRTEPAGYKTKSNLLTLREFPADQNVLKCLQELQESSSGLSSSGKMAVQASSSLPPWKYLYKVYCDFSVDWTTPTTPAIPALEQKVKRSKKKSKTLKRFGDLVHLDGGSRGAVDDFKWLETKASSVAGGQQQQRMSSVFSAVRLLHYLFEFKAGSAVVHEDVWTSPRLYNKLEMQLQDALSVCSGIYPKWCDRMVTQCRFFFPRELREKLFRATAFGCTRSLHWFRNQVQMEESNSGSSDGSGGGAMNSSGGIIGGGIHNQEITITPIPKERVKVHRANILSSAEAVMKMHAKRRAILDIVFVGEKGYGSGVTAAFYSATALALQSIEQNKRKHVRCWVSGDENTGSGSGGADGEDEVIRHPNGLFPFPDTKPSSKLIERFRMMGRLAGKALMDERILPLPLSTQFMKLVVGESFAIDEIADIFLSPGKILLSIRDAAKKLEQGVANVQIDKMDLDDWLAAVSFTFIEPLSQEPLFAGGVDTAVTSANLGEYVDSVLNVWLAQGIEAQVLAFREGISEVLPLDKLKLLFVPELLSLLCGDADIKWDAESLLKTMKLAHGYTSASAPVQFFVKFLDEMSVCERRAFLLYATGCPNLPPGGFQGLKPVFEVVRRVVETDDVDHALPFARTCTNTLHLPAYSSKEVLTKQMRFAIGNSRGVIDRD